MLSDLGRSVGKDDGDHAVWIESRQEELQTWKHQHEEESLEWPQKNLSGD
ncbi:MULTISPECIES: hypothetical protein [unclassified Azospirillum]|nr:MULTISPECIES: hypothetical protein [unclassified Azospirillum]